VPAILIDIGNHPKKALALDAVTVSSFAFTIYIKGLDAVVTLVTVSVVAAVYDPLIPNSAAVADPL
jgi:hypothetical protein